jgi:VIT1/CCC1 family predicted Fe2+/Mn2+ transporter
MTDYKATSEQWNQVQKCADVSGSSDCSAILELRARIETLENAAHKHVVETNSNIVALFTRVESLEAAERQASKVYEISKPLKLTAKQQEEIAALLRPDPKPTVKGPLLVTRVAAVISQDGDPINWPGAYAAIREVAAWMTSNPDIYFPPALVFALEQEAER